MQYTQTGTPRADLGRAFWEYYMNYSNLIGLKVAPIYRAPRNTATFPALTRESLTQDIDLKRNKDGTYNRAELRAEDISYKVEEFGVEIRKDDVKRLTHKMDFDLDMASAEAAAWFLAIGQEKRIATMVFNTTTWTGAALYLDVSGSAPWATTSSDIRATIRTIKAQMLINCGLEPNTIVMNTVNRDRVKNNDDYMESIKYVDKLTEANMNAGISEFFGIPKVLVGAASYNSADEGQTFSGTNIWSSTYVWVGVTPGEGEEVIAPSACRTPLWVPDSPETETIDEYREDNTRGDIVRARQQVDEVVVDPYFGFLLKVA
jgi:hypothetical protein